MLLIHILLRRLGAIQHFPPLWWKFERSFSQTHWQLLHPRYRCFLTVASGVSGVTMGAVVQREGLRPCRVFNAKICIRHYSGGRLFLPAALWGKSWADPCPGLCLWKWHHSHMNQHNSSKRLKSLSFSWISSLLVKMVGDIRTLLSINTV